MLLNNIALPRNIVSPYIFRVIHWVNY